MSAVIFQVWLPAASATAFNWSSVAARPVVAVPFQVVFVKPVTVPVAPSTLTELAPPVVIVFATPSTTVEPIVVLPVVPSTVTALAPEPSVTLSLSFTS